MFANPFKPTAGKTPPAMIGREGVMEEFIEGMENGAGAPGRLMRIAGVRGTGKTVLLGELAKLASDLGWLVIDEVASEGLNQRILDRVQPEHRLASASIAPSALGISMGSVQVERIGPTLREALAGAIKKNRHGLLITLDEVQDAVLDEMRVLAIAIQQLIGDDLDVAFVFAGLPSMIDGVINGKTLTFLRRAVPFELQAVNTVEVATSLADTMAKSGVSLSDDLAGYLAEASRGYPFLIQLVGYHAWQGTHRRGSVSVTQEIAEQSVRVARSRFDQMVIEPALQRVSPLGIAYLLAMAQDGGKQSRSAAVAARLDRTTQELSSVRSRLLRDSLIEAPQRGKVSFAIPYMAEYLSCHAEDLEAELEA